MLLAVNFIKKEILKDVNFNNIKEDRFKTGRVSMTLFTPLKNETASKNAIVPFILNHAGIIQTYKAFTRSWMNFTVLQ